MRYPLEVFVTAIIRGDYSSVKTPPPLWSPDAITSRARRALVQAAREPWADPRHVAIALGHNLLPRRPPSLCGEGTAPGLIAYDPTVDLKTRGMYVAHGTSHQIGLTQPEDLRESDMWLLTVAMLVPPHLVHHHDLRRIEQWAHAPAWMVREAVRVIRGDMAELEE